MAKAPLEKTIADAMYMLRMHGKRFTGGRVTYCTTVPFITDAEFKGQNLAAAVLPPVPTTGAEAHNLFDIWLWPVWHGEGRPQAELMEVNQPLCHFVMLGKDFAEQTVRLLVALGNTPGAHLEWDECALMVHHQDGESYGIIDGMTRSRFCTGVKVSADYERMLTETSRIRIVSVDFASLYREAERKGRGLQKLLVAMYTWRPELSWARLARTAVPRKTPSKRQFDAWIKIMSDPIDPVAKLYKHLVPQWLAPSQFTHLVVGLGSRPMGPSERVKQGYIDRLADHFHQE